MPSKSTEALHNFLNQALDKIHWHDDNIKTRLLHAFVGAFIGYYSVRIVSFFSMFAGLTLLGLELARSVFMIPIDWQRINNTCLYTSQIVGTKIQSMDCDILMCRGLISGMMMGASFQTMPFWSLLLLRPVLTI